VGLVVKLKRAVGTILLIVGIFTILFASYQKRRIDNVGAKIHRQMEMGNTYFQQVEPAQGFTNIVTKPIKKMTDAELARYYQIVQNLTIWGVVIAVIGAGIVVYCVKAPKRRRK
jgi:uncharacterized ion transporter superfamily protein YfcC